MNVVDFSIDSTWYPLFNTLFNTPKIQDLELFLNKESEKFTIYPERSNFFNAFALTPLNRVKVVILGQDPYHGPNQAHGLAFSVENGEKTPPSLKNIFTELCDDLHVSMPNTKNLTAWAKEGVLLLNTVLTVRANEAHSHKNRGWEFFTHEVIKHISEKCEHCVFILWGKPAQEYKKIIDTNKHYIIESAHPSPLSAYRGFFKSKPFSKTNTYLLNAGMGSINWCL